DRALRVTDRWSKSGALDSAAVSGLDSSLVADAVLLIKITEWETKRFHNIGEGQSYTTIGLHFALFGIKDRKKTWSKEVREQRLAQEIDASSGMVSYDATGRIQSPNATDPPRVHDVASDLVRDALKKFPTKRGSSRPPWTSASSKPPWRKRGRPRPTAKSPWAPSSSGKAGSSAGDGTASRPPRTPPRTRRSSRSAPPRRRSRAGGSTRPRSTSPSSRAICAPARSSSRASSASSTGRAIPKPERAVRSPWCPRI